jgi:hypothetical protein
LLVDNIWSKLSSKSTSHAIPDFHVLIGDHVSVGAKGAFFGNSGSFTAAPRRQINGNGIVKGLTFLGGKESNLEVKVEASDWLVAKGIGTSGKSDRAAIRANRAAVFGLATPTRQGGEFDTAGGRVGDKTSQIGGCRTCQATRASNLKVGVDHGFVVAEGTKGGWVGSITTAPSGDMEDTVDLVLDT